MKTRETVWAWEGHLARGSLSILAGVPGGGKSHIQACYAASVTNGIPWPDGTPGLAQPKNVVMLVAEDCLETTLAPRLIAAGADMRRIHVLKTIHKDSAGRSFILGEDIDVLEEVIQEIGDVGLITIDPVTAYMGGKADAHKATDVRNQLGPLFALAERHDIPISLVTHPAKNAGGRAIDHFLGSQAFIATVRLADICVEEVEGGECTGRWLLACAKNSSARSGPR